MKTITSLLTILLFVGANISRAQINGNFVSSNITTNTLVASSFINDNEGWIIDNMGILRHTTDATQTWSSIVTEKYFLKLDFTDATMGYGITAGGIYKTTDAGSTWFSLSMPGDIGNALYFLDNNTGFVSGHEAIYRTSDGGNTWVTVATEGVSFLDYFFVNSFVGIAAVLDRDSSKCIWKTTDGGSTWNNVYREEDYVINSVWFTNESTGWAAGYYLPMGYDKLPIINKTTDGGLTWKNVYLNRFPGNDGVGEQFLDIRFTSELNGFALSTYAESLVTSDGGATWSFTYNPDGSELLPSYGIYKSLDGFGTLYLTGEQGYVTAWK